MKTLRIWNCLALHDESLFEIAKLKNLTKLCAGDNRHFTSKGFAEILKSTPQLEILDFSCCPNVKSDLIAELILNGHNLKCLKAEFCPDFATDSLLTSLGSASDMKLEALILGDGTVTNAGISELIKSEDLKKTLRCIDLRRNNDVGLEGYDILASNFQLEELDGCSPKEYGDSAGQFFMTKRLSMDN